MAETMRMPPHSTVTPVTANRITASEIPVPPKYWRYDPSAELGHAVMRYLTADPLSADDIRMITVYLQQWIGSRAWERIRRGRVFGNSLYVLRIAARRIHTRMDIDDWREDAVALGIDPF